MKSQDEIQRAHDILAALILEEVPIRIKPEQAEALSAAAGALCWVLNHDHNKSFEENLARIEQMFEELGIDEIRTITN